MILLIEQVCHQPLLRDTADLHTPRCYQVTHQLPVQTQRNANVNCARSKQQHIPVRGCRDPGDLLW